MATIRNRLQNAGGPFRKLQEEEERADCESASAPATIKAIEKATDSFVNGRRSNTDTDEISAAHRTEWVNGTGPHVPDRVTFQSRINEVARVARFTRTIFHEPHHDLSPGMLLIDEIFNRMVVEVGRIIAAAGPRTPAQEGSAGWLGNARPNLQAFVNGLSTGIGPGGAYGTYIHPAGDHQCPGQPGAGSFHVDPSRIELFLDVDDIKDLSNPKLITASVIVGAWKGGTHSKGHTT
ncbi:MAG: hypothetical protein EXS31_14000 [Pedosphaera sp.]|nr:hypothetical protein [Pedosphaera sp.]